MLAGRKRKRKCSTGKFSLRALRDQMLAGQKEETGERGNESLTGRFSHTASAVRPNARWTKEKT